MNTEGTDVRTNKEERERNRQKHKRWWKPRVIDRKTNNVENREKHKRRWKQRVIDRKTNDDENSGQTKIQIDWLLFSVELLPEGRS